MTNRASTGQVSTNEVEGKLVSWDQIIQEADMSKPTHEDKRIKLVM